MKTSTEETPKEVNKEYTLEELIEYNNKLQELADTQNPYLVLNDSVAHAALIMATIFNKSQYKVDMYCGELSIFRDEFKNKVENKIINPNIALLDPITLLNNSLIEFLERKGTRLNIIVEKNMNTIPDIAIWDKIEKYILEGKLAIYQYHNHLTNSYHFSIGDDYMFRRETDRELRTAFACFGEKEKVKILQNTFNNILNTNPEKFTFKN